MQSYVANSYLFTNFEIMGTLTKAKIHFFFQQPIPLPGRSKLKAFIVDFFKKEGKSLKTLNYIFCSDQQLLKINQRFLHHDFFTDIITFNLSGFPKEIEGEIYISVTRVKENALHLKVPFKEELFRVIFHGVLHLCGYEDNTRSKSALMRKKENQLLSGFLV